MSQLCRVLTPKAVQHSLRVPPARPHPHLSTCVHGESAQVCPCPPGLAADRSAPAPLQLPEPPGFQHLNQHASAASGGFALRLPSTPKVLRSVSLLSLGTLLCGSQARACENALRPAVPPPTPGCHAHPGMGSPSPWAPAAHRRLLPPPGVIPGGLLAQAAPAAVLCTTQGPWGRVRIPQKAKAGLPGGPALPGRAAQRIARRIRAAAGRGQQSPRPPGRAGARAEGRGRPSLWGTGLAEAPPWAVEPRRTRGEPLKTPDSNLGAPL